MSSTPIWIKLERQQTKTALTVAKKTRRTMQLSDESDNVQNNTRESRLYYEKKATNAAAMRDEAIGRK